jgi:chromosome segregation ATPase
VGKTSGTLWTLVLLMLLTVVGGGYWAYNKLTDVDLLLTVSRGELDHARKRIGELEALVVATDVNSNKSGTVVQTQVKLIDNRAKERNKFLDTEIDKLWGVAYRTNRPAIEENQKATDNNTATVKQHKEQIQSQGQLFEQQQIALQTQQTQVDKVTHTSQLAVQQVEDQLHKLVLLQDKLAQVLSTVSTHEKALSDQNKTSLGHAQLAQQQAQDVAALESTIQQQQQTLAVFELTVQQHEQALAVFELTVQQHEQALVEMTVLLESASSADQTDALSSRVNRLESSTRLVTALEQNASQMDERVFMVEQSLDSVDSFRRDTNRSLDQVRAQIRNLAYGE